MNCASSINARVTDSRQHYLSTPVAVYIRSPTSIIPRLSPRIPSANWMSRPTAGLIHLSWRRFSGEAAQHVIIINLASAPVEVLRLLNYLVPFGTVLRRITQLLQVTMSWVSPHFVWPSCLLRSIRQPSWLKSMSVLCWTVRWCSYKGRWQ